MGAHERHNRTRIPLAGSSSAPSPEGVGSTDIGNYSHPFGWWGYHWTPPEPRSLVWLISHEMLDTLTAAFLSLAVEARTSLIVIAEPHEAGKTTLLTALLDFLPDDTSPIYLRGWYERFAFVDQIPASHAYVLCNEISAHLPTYLWGHGVRRMFEAVAAGYPLATTMHATSAVDALRQLASYPLEVPEAHLTPLELVVTIGVGYASNRLLRRVTRIERLRRDGDATRIDTLAERDSLRGDLRYQIGQLIGVLGGWHGCSDAETAAMLARRTRDLEDWAGQGLAASPSLRAQILAGRRH